MTRRDLIARVTGMNFCGRDCGCGENSQLWFFPAGADGVRRWVPSWMNGVETAVVWEWLVENGKVRRKAKESRAL
jgi:hypothetical protein